MKVALGLLSLASLATAYKYDVAIGKKLFNGDKTVVQTVHLEEMEKGLNIHFDFSSASNVKNTTVYLANKEKQITAVTFTEKNVLIEQYTTPFLLSEDGTHTIEVSDVQPNLANYVVDYAMLPPNVTAASASFIDGNGDIYNYYGIKNYLISLPDRFIVESYMVVNFPQTNSSNE